jgi:hypothetical protein
VVEVVEEEIGISLVDEVVVPKVAEKEEEA